VYKGINILDNLNVIFSVDVVNLLNRKNVNLSGGGWNSYTGAVTKYGDYDPNERYVYLWNEFGTRVPPYAFGPPRQVSLGMKVNWN
jgi:hypothetical protein